MKPPKKIEVMRPQKGYQTMFATSRADIVIGGSSAGVGKTFSLLFEYLRHGLTVTRFGSVIFRRTTPQIRSEGGLWDKSVELFSKVMGAKGAGSYLTWVFRKKKDPKFITKLKFSHLEHESNLADWQGSEICYIGFDELTHFTKKMFFYFLTRNRSTCGVKPYIRATCNPDPWSFVRELLVTGGYVDDLTGKVIPEMEGVVRYFVLDGDKYVWGDSYEEVYEKTKHIIDPQLEKAGEGFSIKDFIKSFSFMAGSIFDNKALLSVDPGYLGGLLNQDEQTKSQLLDSNWNLKSTDLDCFDASAFQKVFGKEVERGQPRLVCDIALEGKNKFVLAYFEGRMMLDLKIIDKSNGPEVVSAMEEMARKHRLENEWILFDSDGVGGFVSGFLQGSIPFGGNDGVIEIEDPISKKIIKEAYQNQKTQLVYHCAKAIKDGLYGITEDIEHMMYDNEKNVRQRILFEMQAFKKAPPNAGKKRIISKEDMGKILGNGQSPDLMDVIWMNEYFELMPEKVDHYKGL